MKPAPPEWLRLEHCFQCQDDSSAAASRCLQPESDEPGAKQPIRSTIAHHSVRRNVLQEETRLATILPCSNYAILALTLNGIIDTWNSGAERLFGYRAEEIVGRSIQILAPDDKSGEYRQILASAGRGEYVDIETVRVSKEGNTIDVALSVSPVTDPAGQVTGVVEIMRDISDRKRTEMALLRSEIQYRLLFERNPIPMWVFDRHSLRFLAVNQAAVRQYGFSKEEFREMTISQIRPEDSVPKMLSDIGKLPSGLQNPGTWTHRRKDATLIEVEIVCHDLNFHGIEAMLVAAHDVTQRREAEEAVREAEQKYRGIFDNAVVGIFQATLDGCPINVNCALAHLLGFDSPEQLLAEVKDVAGQLFVDPERVHELHATLSRRHVCAAEVEVYRRDRSRTWMRVNLRAVRDPEGKVELIQGTVEDISERKRAEEALEFKTALLEAQSETTIDGILVVDEAGNIVLANKRFETQFGVPHELIVSREDFPVLKHIMNQMEDPESFVQRARYLYSHRCEKGRDELKLKDGRSFDRYSAPLIDSKSMHRGRIWYFRDITDRKAAEARIEYQAYYDALTDLPNRSLLQDRLSKLLAGAHDADDKVAVLFLDLDHFKLINDSLGHTLGDLLLRDVAGRLKECIRERDTAARVGGDEFVVLLSNLNDVADAVSTAARIVESIKEKFLVQGHSLSTSCSVGISIFPDHATDCETLIKYADQAMSCAKEGGRNRFKLFSESLNRQILDQLNVDRALHLALEREEFFLAFQPQMVLASGEIAGVEALIRWQHPELGLVPPDQFIPIAERNGLILSIGEWVLKSACTHARRWYDKGILVAPVAVNVSSVQFRQEGFCDLIKTVLSETGLPSNYLELELTESVLLCNEDVMLSVLRELREMGVRLAIDDFGTGYSSFGYLKQFRVNKLKIDRSFIRDIATNSDDAAITTAIIRMARSLNLTVIAEGVEEEEQLSFLRDLRCDEIQGYYFSKPISSTEIEEELIRAQKRKPMPDGADSAIPVRLCEDPGPTALSNYISEAEFVKLPPPDGLIQ